MEKICDVILVTFIGNIMTMTSLTNILKFDFVIISLKNKIWPHHVTLGHENRRLRGAGGSEDLLLK